MAGISGPDIVDNGLILALDAANRNSYRIGSSNWFDVTGTNITGSLKSNPPYSSSYAGGIALNGSTNYIDINSTNIVTSTNPFTVECCYNRNPSGVPGRLFGNAGTGYTGDYLSINTNGVTIGTSLSMITLIEPSAGPHYVCVTRSDTSVVAYRDGTSWLSGTITGKTGGTIQVGANFRVGSTTNSAGGIGSSLFAGQILSLKIYNRAITASEMVQNFNAIKGRLNL